MMKVLNPDKRFMVHAYIRSQGALTESVYLNVAAPDRESAHSMVKWYYRQKGYDAGINADSTIETQDFDSMFSGGFSA